MLGRIQIVLTILLCSSLCVYAANLPALPSWNAADKVKVSEGRLVVGVALLTKGGLKKPEGDVVAKPVEVIIEAVDEKPREIGSVELSSHSKISGEYLGHYFGRRPESTLIDPQRLLSMQERMDMNYALKTHEDDSDVSIFVYLFDSNQRVPEAYSPQQVYDSSFGENASPVVLVYYYIGAPERSEFLLAGGASSQVPQWQIRELLWNAAHKAREKSDSFDQLDGFVAQLSMRLFWIEEILRDLVVETLPIERVEVGAKQGPRSEKVEKLLKGSVMPYFHQVLICGVVSSIVIVLMSFYFYKRRLYFPGNPTSQRLGGEVGGMFGGVLSYRNRKQPPSEQRRQFDKDFF